MAWRESTDIKDRIFAALPYLLPLFYLFFITPFGTYLIAQFPLLTWLELPLLPIALLYSLVPFGFGGLIIFFVLYLAVVRNEKISHFIRFNVLQAILLDILLFLISLVLGIVAKGLGGGLLVETLYNTVFIGVLAVCGYGIVQSALGRYAEIPTISEAASSQIR